MAGPYFVRGGVGGDDSGSSWANAAESIAGLMTARLSRAARSSMCITTHAFLAGAAITWTLPESGTGTVRVLCVDGGDAAFSDAAAMSTTVGR